MSDELKRKTRDPKIIYTRRFADPPGSQEELDAIMERWELALARRARDMLRAEREAAKQGQAEGSNTQGKEAPPKQE